MFRKIGLVLIALLSTGILNAQTFWERMESFAGKPDNIGTMKNNAYVIEGEGTLIANDGVERKGTLKFTVGTDVNSIKMVQFFPDGSMRSEDYTAKKVKSFTIMGHIFDAIKTKVSSDDFGNDVIFMERMNENPNGRFKMYIMRLLKMDPNFPVSVERQYFAQLPDFPMAYGLEDIKFTPFAKKMSEYLKDCPELSKRVAEKEEGYKYNMFKGAANRAVFFRIMDEYNTCEVK